MAGKSRTTKDHDTIRRWVEERGGWPAHVAATGEKEDPGLLRIDFPGYSGSRRLEKLSWDDFFEKFDEKDLLFLYQDQMRSGAPSRFWKLVTPESVDERKSGDGRAGGSRVSAKASGGRKTAAKKPAQKKPTAKKAATKKSTTKKSTTKKSTAKKTAAQKPIAKKATAKKTAAKKTAAKKTAARKSTAPKTAAKKSTVRKSAAKKASARKPSQRTAKSAGGDGRARRSTSRSGASNRTSDHETIRQWVEERGGWPARVKTTGGKDDPGLLRVDFPGYSGKKRLERVSWDDFFEKFDEKNLEFLYQDRLKSGKPSRFWKFVSRES